MHMRKKTSIPSNSTAPAGQSIYRRLPWLLLIPLGWLLPLIADQYPQLVEQIYSQSIYPVLSAILRTLFGIVPFSIAEWLLYILIAFVPGSILYLAIRAVMRRIPWRMLLNRILTYAIIFGVVLNAYYLLWGFQYARPTLETLLSLEVKARPQEELEQLCADLVRRANLLRQEVTEDADGVFQLKGGIDACLNEIPKAYRNLREQLPFFDIPATRPKQVLYSEGLSWMGIAGIFVAFTAEPNINVHQSPLLIPASAAHESAHGIGIAREEEANFVAYLACTFSNDADLQYSGTMLALIHATNQLSDLDRDVFSAIYQQYDAGLKRDLVKYNAYWRAYEGPLEETMEKINDGYLKHHQQESGVRSYGQMVDLLLAWYDR